MKILLLSQFYLSGQSTHVTELAKSLSKQNHHVIIIFTKITTPRFKIYYGPDLQRHGVDYRVVSNRTQILRLIDRFNPDVIHVHSSPVFETTRVLANLRKKPYIVTLHGLGLDSLRYRRALQDASRIIAVGPKTAQNLLPLYKDKIRIIGNGVDTEYFHPQKKDEKLQVIYLGRLDTSKVKPIRALQDAVKTIPGLSLKLVGNWKPPIKQLHFSPWENDTAQLLGANHIMAGSGRSAREALACGNVVLLMNQGYDGIITEDLVNLTNFDFSGNIGRFPFSQLAKDLSSLVEDREKLARIQEFSREFAVKHLSISQMTEHVLTVYNQAIHSVLPYKQRRLRAILRLKYWCYG